MADVKIQQTPTTTTPNVELQPLFQVGWQISGQGIPSGTIVVSVQNPTTPTTTTPTTTPTPEPTPTATPTPATTTSAPTAGTLGFIADSSFGAAAGNYCEAGTYAGSPYYAGSNSDGSSNGWLMYFDPDLYGWNLSQTNTPGVSSSNGYSANGDPGIVPLTGWFGDTANDLNLATGNVCEPQTRLATPIITITNQPQTVNLGYGTCGGQQTVPHTFTVGAVLSGSDASLSYQWQYTNNQSQWVNFTDETLATGIYTNSLTTRCGDTGLPYLPVKAPFRVIISAPGTSSVISDSAGFSYYQI